MLLSLKSIYNPLTKHSMKKITIILLSILTLNSCEPSDEYQIVNIDDQYSLTIPSFLTKVNNLNDNASLQYQHGLKEFYVIVIDESKIELQNALEDYQLTEYFTNDVKGYSDLLLEGFEQTVSIKQKSTILDTLINGMPARLLTISGRIDGIDAYYSLAFIQGRHSYYQIMAWTLSSKEFEYKDKMNRIMYTFKEFN